MSWRGCGCRGVWLIEAALGSAWLGGAALAAPGDVTVRTVATLGQSAPGFNERFFTFDAPVLNDAGRVAFGASVGNGSPRGIWSEGMGALSLVAAGGQNAPESGSAQFTLFSELVLNDAGQTAFHAQLMGPGVVPGNAHAVYSQTGAGGALRKVARTGDPAPSFPGLNDVFTGLVETRLNNAGRVALAGGAMSISPPGSSRGAAWWEDQSTGQLRALARQDAAAPGVTPTATFNTIHSPALNDQGQVLLSVELTSGAMLWSSGGKIFRNGETVPARTLLWGSFDGEAVLNNAGKLAFVASSRAAPGGPLTEGVWTGGPSGMTELYRPGTPAPAMGAGAVFGGGALPSPVINGNGDLAFRASVNTPTGSVGTIYATRNGGQAPELLVRAGQAAPGTPAGTVISSFPVGMEAPGFNSRGTAAFLVALAGPGVTMANDQAIYASVGGVLRLIAREGDPIQVRPGVTRTVLGLGLLSDSGNQDGRPSALNEYDQLAFMARLADGSFGQAVFVADVGLAGDVDGDRVVNHTDFVLFQQNFGRAGHRGQGDFNGDGRISFADFQIMERNFGKTLAMVAGAAMGASVTAVPEPGVGALILSAAIGCALSRPRRSR